LKQKLVNARQRLLLVIGNTTHWLGTRTRPSRRSRPSRSFRKLNEELETAIEELWSINEEVTKANQALLSTVRPFLVLGAALRVITANQSFERVFGLSPGEVEGEPLYSISGGSWNIPRLREMLERILADSNAAPAFEIEQVFPGVGRKVLAITARQLGGGQQILLDIKDVTELMSAPNMACTKAKNVSE
jgi:PAS domain-containing protein